MLSIPSFLCSFSRNCVVFAKDVQYGSSLQLCSIVRLPLPVDQQGKSDAGLFAKDAGIVVIAQPDRRQASSFGSESLMTCAQLSYVLAAKNSAVVPQKDNNCRTVGPQCTQLHLLTVSIRQRNLSKPGAERHPRILSPGIQTVKLYLLGTFRISRLKRLRGLPARVHSFEFGRVDFKHRIEFGDLEQIANFLRNAAYQ